MLVPACPAGPFSPWSLASQRTLFSTDGPRSQHRQELWQVACQWVWNLRLSLGKTMQRGELREIEWAPPKEAPPFFVAEETPPQEDGPWQWAAAFGRATGLICAQAFVLQENGTLPSGGKPELRAKCVKRMNLRKLTVYLAS